MKGSLWLGTGRSVLRTGTASGASGTSARHAPVRATVLPQARAVDYTPTHTTVGPSGPVRPSAVEQVRAADAPDDAPNCEEPWCRVVVERAGTLCAEHREQHRPRGLDAVEHEHGQCATALPGGQRVVATARVTHGPHGYPAVHQGAQSSGGRR